VFLQNCHLAASWMPSLEKIVNNLPETEIMDGFRLILSSMPTPHFPVSILQDGVKVTNEPPLGLKANLARSFAELTESSFEDFPTKANSWKRLLFGLCFFHAVIQERKKFGPLGWNVKYEFNESDLEVAIATLKMYLQESGHMAVPWQALQYLTGEIYYGGRVTDEWDRRCLMSILSKFYSPALLEDGYKFSPSGIYSIPTESSLQSYRQYIESLPLIDKPEIFGLHENADITHQTQETYKVIYNLLSIQPRLVSAGGKTSDQQLVLQLAKKISESLPLPLNMADAHESLFKKDSNGMVNSLHSFLDTCSLRLYSCAVVPSEYITA
jgi:dynein heavy chain